MDRTGYRPRVIDRALADEMKAFGCVVLVGPKMCGKTTTAETICVSEIKLQKKNEYDRYRKIADIDPSIVLQSDYPLLIDEWQRIPELWDAVRTFIDDRQEKGLFIFTGSNNIDEKLIFHSGAGRISRLRMYTMSLFELGRSSGKVSLGKLFDGEDIPADVSRQDIVDIAESVVRGGWPGNLGLETKIARKAVAGYCRTLLESDINIDGERKRDPQKMAMILRSLSRNESSEVTTESILRDISSDGSRMNINTLYDYLSALERIYITDNLPAWSPKLRSKTAVRTSPVRHLTDPSIAAYFLDAGPEDLLRDPETFGLLFEGLVIRDLKIYAQGIDGKVYHYRDSDGLEADAVIHTDGGRWAAFEVKLSEKYIDAAARNLLKLARKVQVEPSFLAVVIPTGTSYRRDDGVFVIPITTLGP